MEQLTEYTLTADEQGMIDPISADIKAMEEQARAVLRAISRLRGLDGNWNLVGNKLIRIPNGNGNGNGNEKG